nr:hypothetical protein [Tanacetum cinerariifolium]
VLNNVDDSHESDADDNQVNDKFKKGIQTNGNAGPKSSENEVADDAGKKNTKVPRKENRVQDPKKEGDNNDQEKDLRDQEEALRKQCEQEFERLFSQREAANTNRLNTDSLPFNAVSSSFTTVDPGRERAQRNEFESMFGQDKDANGNMMFTPDTGIFSGTYDDEVEGAMADFNNLELTIIVSPIPAIRIHKDHPKEKIIGDPLSVLQTRRMTKTSQEHAMVNYIKKQRRNNHKDYQNCLFSCFLSKIEPKKKVWRLVDLPKGKHAIRTKWVYKNKKDKRGIIVRNKARLVAQGYTQEEGIDYDDVFAPVARIEAIRLFLAYASFMRFIVYQINMKSAFLYGTIEEEVYVCQPPSFEDPYFSDKVYKVEKALYALHQALGACQDKYVVDILKKFDFSSVKTASTPIETNKVFLKDEEAEDVDVHLYRLMIGSLMYLTASSSDITFTVCACARFQISPKVSHLHDAYTYYCQLKVSAAKSKFTTAGDGYCCWAKPNAITTTATTVTAAGIRPKEKEIVMQEPSETPSLKPIDSSQQSSKAKDKGKAKMMEPEKPLKGKEQIMIDEEVARNLEAQMQDELEEEERLARQKE